MSLRSVSYCIFSTILSFASSSESKVIGAVCDAATGMVPVRIRVLLNADTVGFGCASSTSSVSMDSSASISMKSPLRFCGSDLKGHTAFGEAVHVQVGQSHINRVSECAQTDWQYGRGSKGCAAIIENNSRRFD